MGQQQLLLVILVTIVVGIATVVALNTFGAAVDSATQDAVRQDMATIGSSAQSIFIKPEMLGGGGRDFTNLTFNYVAFGGEVDESDDTLAANDNGTYTLDLDVEFFTIAATVNDSDESVINAIVCADNIVIAAIGEAAPGISDCEDDDS